MKTTIICLILVGVLVCFGCAVTDVDPTANLASYDSFGWGKSTLAISNPAYHSELIEARIKAGVTTELAKKGVFFKAKKADLLVSYEGYIENRERGYAPRLYFYPYYAPYYRGVFYPAGGYMMGAWSDPYTYETYTEGTLTLNVRDRKSAKLIWRGVVRGNVDNLKSLNRNIEKAVRAILKKYPAVPPKLPPLPKEKVVS